MPTFVWPVNKKLGSPSGQTLAFRKTPRTHPLILLPGQYSVEELMQNMSKHKKILVITFNVFAYFCI